jgi:DNA mismatch endonuclease (patch repair protein)
MPKSRKDYWIEKIETNQRRDRRARRRLRALGWNVIVVWECELKQPDRLAAKLKNAL